MSRFTVKLISAFFGLIGITLLVTEAIRAYNEGIYADVHHTVGRFDLTDGLLVIGGLISLVLSLGLSDQVYSKLIRK